MSRIRNIGPTVAVLAVILAVGHPLRGAGDLGNKNILHLVNRITFGARLADLEEAKSLGYNAYLRRQLDPRAIDDAAVEAHVSRLDTLALGPADIASRYPYIFNPGKKPDPSDVNAVADRAEQQ